MTTTRTHVLIVGGSRGIGRATALAFAESGATVSIVSRKAPEDLNHPFIHFATMDVTNACELPGHFDEMVKARGPFRSAVFLQRHRGGEDSWEAELATSLSATRTLTELLVTHLDEGKDHGIVYVSSMASRFVASEQSIGYHAAKAALEQMARYYAVRLGHQDIRVNAVALGAVIKPESRVFYEQHPDLVKLYSDITPLGRMGTAEEIAAAILFLCSPAASFITGHTLVVDGGLSLQWHESLARGLTPLKDIQVTRHTKD